MNNEHYIYKFVDIEGNVLYVGKTNNLERRIKTHFSKHGHLPKELYYRVVNVWVTRVEDEPTCNLYEIYYIEKYKPPFNTIYNTRNGETRIKGELCELDFFLYKTIEQPYDNADVPDYFFIEEDKQPTYLTDEELIGRKLDEELQNNLLEHLDTIDRIQDELADYIMYADNLEELATNGDIQKVIWEKTVKMKYHTMQMETLIK